MLPIARLGDKHMCPAHGPNMIVSGGTALVDGRPIARVGDKTMCGAIIIEGSSMGTDDGKPVAYLGCKTNHGGVIVEGSPMHLIKP
ncbi:PAAR domain-containing protein [Jannaschia pohangensis]|uniref:Zn-binding Pro-Ala-Ala-Arg (PAAR) domain-containing protein, incolved in TypeVI secretion n=1 Tax=Jannaschia pohangensis TaxID=390807 RepID=A0A1I3ULE9_9RHOB|nr:PAAR domain-containing protein [Jannaschia pohangensis]SFJ83742.1 Zn-binding Pro-Ala-Ala-Arg (PAAR) domain-containing protein, incolved in TypeVI secretion [Jannaschia pohangensis]